MTLGGAPINSPATSSSTGPVSTANNRPEPEAKLELSFEYLVAADKLVWITVVSSQAILMSICLQSMVEELVRIRAGEKEPRRLTRCAAKPRVIQVRVYEDWVRSLTCLDAVLVLRLSDRLTVIGQLQN